MKEVTFLFQNRQDLHRFMDIVECNYIETIEEGLTLTCTCDEPEIELAADAFNAKVIKIDIIPS
jgi:hypothetical protein